LICIPHQILLFGRYQIRRNETGGEGRVDITRVEDRGGSCGVSFVEMGERADLKDIGVDVE